MNNKRDDLSVDVQNQIKTIALIATGTLATFGGLVMALPVFDFWAKVLPAPGRYEVIARVIGILLSALLAYREVRYKWPDSSLKRRPDGVLQVMLGGLLTLAYLATQQLPLGEWTNLLYAIEYCGIVILISFGFIRLAKKAYDFSIKKAYFDKLVANYKARQKVAAKLAASRTPGAKPTQVYGVSLSDDVRFVRFSAAFFTAITAAVTGFAILNQIVSILPPIVKNLAVANALSVLIATMIVGSNYISEYLESNISDIIGRATRQIDGIVRGRNIVEAGFGPVSLGIVCIILYLVGATWLQSRPSDDVLVEILLIISQIGIFSFISYGLWRLGVNEYERRQKPTI